METRAARRRSQAAAAADHASDAAAANAQLHAAFVERVRLATGQHDVLARLAGVRGLTNRACLLRAREANVGVGLAAQAPGPARVRLARASLPTSRPTPVCALDSAVFCTRFSQDGQKLMLATQDGLIRIYDTHVWQRPWRDITARFVGWAIIDASLSPNQQLVAWSTWQSSVQLCRLSDTGDRYTHLILALERLAHFCVFSLSFSRDSRELICGCNHRSLYVCDLVQNLRPLHIRGHADDVNAAQFLDDSSQTFVSGSDDCLGFIWDRRQLNERTPRPVGTLIGHTAGITSIDSRRDGRYIITNSKDQSIKLWDMRRLASEAIVADALPRLDAYRSAAVDYRFEVPRPSALPASMDVSLATYRGHIVAQTLIRCHFSPAFTTGQRYIYTGSADGRLYLYDTLGDGSVRTTVGNHVRRHASRRASAPARRAAPQPDRDRGTAHRARRCAMPRGIRTRRCSSPPPGTVAYCSGGPRPAPRPRDRPIARLIPPPCRSRHALPESDTRTRSCQIRPSLDTAFPERDFRTCHHVTMTRVQRWIFGSARDINSCRFAVSVCACGQHRLCASRAARVRGRRPIGRCRGRHTRRTYRHADAPHPLQQRAIMAKSRVRAPTVGDGVGDFELCRIIGRGSFSTVYAGRDRRTGAMAAVKVVPHRDHRGACGAECADERRRGEALLAEELRIHTLVQSLPCEFIADLLEPRLVRGSAYAALLFRLCDGGDLFDYIERHDGIEPALAARWFQQLMMAVAHCHARGVCHLDIKLENMFIDTASNSIRLGDFGLAAACGPAGGTVVGSRGSLAYMAPEVVRARTARRILRTRYGQDRGALHKQVTCGDVDCACSLLRRACIYQGYCADMWSCGIVLHILLHDISPWEAADRDLSPEYGAWYDSGGVLGAWPHVLARPGAAIMLDALLRVRPSERWTATQALRFMQTMPDWADGRPRRTATAPAFAPSTSRLRKLSMIGTGRERAHVRRGCKPGCDTGSCGDAGSRINSLPSTLCTAARMPTGALKACAMIL